MGKHYSATFWFGIVIGVLSTLLCAALAIIFVPRLRPIVGLDNNNANNGANNIVNNSSVIVRPYPTPGSNVPDEIVVAEPIVDSEASIKVTEPTASQKVGNPMIIRGEARVFENTVSLRVTDSNGTILAETFTNAAAPDVGEFGLFEISLTYKTPRGTTGTLEVFENSAKDGSEINKVTVQVRFK